MHGHDITRRSTKAIDIYSPVRKIIFQKELTICYYCTLSLTTIWALDGICKFLFLHQTNCIACLVVVRTVSLIKKSVTNVRTACLVEIERISTVFCRGFNSLLLSRKRISILSLNKKHFSVEAHKYWVQLWMKFRSILPDLHWSRFLACDTNLRGFVHMFKHRGEGKNRSPEVVYHAGVSTSLFLNYIGCETLNF